MEIFLLWMFLTQKSQDFFFFFFCFTVLKRALSLTKFELKERSENSQFYCMNLIPQHYYFWQWFLQLAYLVKLKDGKDFSHFLDKDVTEIRNMNSCIIFLNLLYQNCFQMWPLQWKLSKNHSYLTASSVKQLLYTCLFHF